MKRSRFIIFELIVAAFTVAVAGAFTHAAVRGEAPAILASVEQKADELGRKVFLGKGNCATCHGQNLKGGPLAPDLTDAQWLHVDGSLEAIEKLVRTGVPKPLKHPAPMPPMGGGTLSEQELKAVSAFVHAQAKPPAAKK